MATIPVPHTWGAGDDATSGYLQTVTDAANFLLSPPRVKVTTVSPQALAVGTITVTWGTEVYDTDSMHSTTTNPDRITIVTPGLYVITTTLELNSTATTPRTVRLYKNGVLANLTTVASTGDAMSISCAIEDTCVAGDYWQVLTANGTASGSLGSNAYSNQFTARFVSS